MIRKLNSKLPRITLITIYKSFVRPHLDYGDVVYDQPSNQTFVKKLERYQYKAALAITGAIQGTSRDKLYQELGLESLESRRYIRRLCLFYKIYYNQSPTYLNHIIPIRNSTYITRNSTSIPQIPNRSQYFRNSFFPYTINEWNKLDPSIQNIQTLASFKSSLQGFFKPKPNSTFNVFDLHGLQLLTRLRLGLSHLRYHKFRHNFRETPNALCSCGSGDETVTHFFLKCPNHSLHRVKLLQRLHDINHTILNCSDDVISNVLLYGNLEFSDSENCDILNASIEFVKKSERFLSSLIEEGQ